MNMFWWMFLYSWLTTIHRCYCMRESFTRTLKVLWKTLWNCIRRQMLRTTKKMPFSNPFIPHFISQLGTWTPENRQQVFVAKDNMTGNSVAKCSDTSVDCIFDGWTRIVIFFSGTLSSTKKKTTSMIISSYK